jgi:geranylgeranyl diphosphate synthase, type I
VTRTQTKLPLLLERLKKGVDAKLASTLKKQELEAERLGPEVLAMVRSVSHLCMRGGKRLRPLFLHLGAICHDPRFALAKSTEAGVALELLQAYFLIHDDWMDEDAERRGGPTAHVELSQALGSSHLGERAAILAGDFAIALAQECLASLKAEPEHVVVATLEFARMQKSAVLGQQLDVVARSDNTELTYLLKTASYTVLGPLHVGLALAGGGPQLHKGLTQYAHPAGVAFQLRDDMLGLFGDPKRTGKPLGADLLSGKRTSFITLAEAELSRGDKRTVDAVFGKRKAKAAAVREALSVLAQSKARSQVEDRIVELEHEALDALTSRHFSSEGRALLREATSALINRDS